MSKLTRREFMSLTTVAILRQRPTPNPQPPAPNSSWPSFDGQLLLDEASRQPMAGDFGGNRTELPLAVLRPASIDDVVKMVRHANERGLRVAMRGQAHSQYGQSLVASGVVIDSSSLASVAVRDDRADLGPGVTWGGVNEVTLARGLTPRVMPDTMNLSAGGVLSVGGWGNTSHSFGGAVDNVEELDVVTGDGRLVTCSAASNRELFEHVLAGLGQCGLIVRARLRLMRTPVRVVRQDLFYDDLAAFVADAQRLAADRRFDHLEPRAIEDGGRWRFKIDAGTFVTSGTGADLASRSEGLGWTSRSKPISAPYADYLQRTLPELTALRARRAGLPQRSGSLVFFIPASAAEGFAKTILASREETFGIWRFGFAPVVVARFTSPLFRLPDSEMAFVLWLFRSAPLDDPLAHKTMFNSNARILERMRGVGGKVYPPYAPFYSRADWEQHYGRLWSRFASAKRTFDPNNVLTPGPGIFGAGLRVQG